MSNIRIRSIRAAATTAVAIVLTAAAPAYATDNVGNSAAASTAATARVTASSKAAQDAAREAEALQEICVTGYQTGTYVRRTFCRARVDWDRDGGVPR